MEEIKNLLDQLTEAYKKNLPESATSVKILINASETKVTISYRNPRSKSFDGLAMRNLKGRIIRE
jgi:hypothetical protein